MTTFPQNIFSVQAATNEGASVSFQSDSSELVSKDCTVKFPIEKHGKLYYLSTDSSDDDKVDTVNYTQDLMGWHETLGHCNDGILKLENVDGMKVAGKTKKSECEVCVMGKMTNEKSKNPRVRATSPMELVHTDLAGLVTPVSHEGFKYAITFTDDFSGAMFVHFLKKNESETVLATEKFFADLALYGKVKIIRSDNGTELTSGEFRALLRKNQIKHEMSAPYSPHQSGTAERNWHTTFEMGRCILIEKRLPKELWLYAVHTAVYIRNRRFNARVQQTPFQALAGHKPNISNMRIFGFDCYAYSQQKQKTGCKMQKGNICRL